MDTKIFSGAYFEFTRECNSGIGNGRLSFEAPLPAGCTTIRFQIPVDQLAAVVMAGRSCEVSGSIVLSEYGDQDSEPTGDCYGVVDPCELPDCTNPRHGEAPYCAACLAEWPERIVSSSVEDTLCLVGPCHSSDCENARVQGTAFCASCLAETSRRQNQQEKHG